MKKIAIILVGVLTLTSCTQKIGYVNTEKLIQDYEGTKKAEEELKEKRTQMEQALKRDMAAFDEKVNKMSPRQQKRNNEVLMQEYNSLRQRDQQLQYTLQGESQKMLEDISKKVNDFVKKYGKDNGYQFVLGTANVNGSVMYGDEKADITYDVLKALNKEYIEPSEETTKEEEPAKTEAQEESKEEKKEESTK